MLRGFSSALYFDGWWIILWDEVEVRKQPNNQPQQPTVRLPWICLKLSTMQWMANPIPPSLKNHQSVKLSILPNSRKFVVILLDQTLSNRLWMAKLLYRFIGQFIWGRDPHIEITEIPPKTLILFTCIGSDMYGRHLYLSVKPHKLLRQQYCTIIHIILPWYSSSKLLIFIL